MKREEKKLTKNGILYMTNGQTLLKNKLITIDGTLLSVSLIRKRAEEGEGRGRGEERFRFSSQQKRFHREREGRGRG